MIVLHAEPTDGASSFAWGNFLGRRQIGVDLRIDVADDPGRIDANPRLPGVSEDWEHENECQDYFLHTIPRKLFEEKHAMTSTSSLSIL